MNVHDDFTEDDGFEVDEFTLSTPDEGSNETEYLDSDEFIQDLIAEEEAIQEEEEEELLDSDLTDDFKEELFASDYETQRAVEKVMAKNHTKSRIMSWLMNHEAMTEYINDKLEEKFSYLNGDEDHEDYKSFKRFLYEFMYQLILRKRIDLLTIVGIMRPITGDATNTISTCVEVMNMGLCLYDPVREQFVVRVNVPEDVQEEIDRFGYPLPMVVKPRYLTNNKQTGYLTIRGSLLLKNNHHDLDINLDHLNRVNRIGLKTNVDAYLNTELVWDGMEKPESIYKLASYNKKIRNYKKFKKDSNTLINMMNEMSDVYYLTHKYDKRGRIYCQGYHFNYQGSDFNKAFIQFADEEVVEL